MKEQILKNLLSALSQTDFKEPLSLTPASSAELKPQQMVTILQRLLGDSIYVVNPAFVFAGVTFGEGTCASGGIGPVFAGVAVLDTVEETGGDVGRAAANGTKIPLPHREGECVADDSDCASKLPTPRREARWAEGRKSLDVLF